MVEEMLLETQTASRFLLPTWVAERTIASIRSSHDFHSGIRT